jgi:hypothetical protein
MYSLSSKSDIAPFGQPSTDTNSFRPTKSLRTSHLQNPDGPNRSTMRERMSVTVSIQVSRIDSRFMLYAADIPPSPLQQLVYRRVPQSLRVSSILRMHCQCGAQTIESRREGERESAANQHTIDFRGVQRQDCSAQGFKVLQCFTANEWGDTNSERL